MRTVSKVYLFSRVFLFAAAVPLLLGLKLARVATILEPGREPQWVDPDRSRKIAAYVETAIEWGRPFVRAGCLTRGLTRYYFFRRAGMDVSLHFGMGRIGQRKEYDGHCWLVRDSEPYLENQDPRTLYIDIYQISREHGRKPTETQTTGRARLTHS